MAKQKTKSSRPAASAAKKKTAAPKPAKPTKPTATAKPAACTRKAALIAEALRHADGATLDELMLVTGWQRHSVRGFLSTHGKKPGAAIEKFTRPDGKTAYMTVAAAAAA